MTGGYVCLLRDRLDDPWLRDPTQPLHRAAAYWWLHCSAAWRPESRIVNGKQWLLQRGQLLISYSGLAAEWKWNVSAVQRFLAKCSEKKWLQTHISHGRMIITLLDYDAWRQTRTEAAVDMANHGERNTARHAGDAPPDTAGVSHRLGKTAENKELFRNNNTADDTGFRKLDRNDDMTTNNDSSKKYHKNNYINSSSVVEARAKESISYHSQGAAGGRADGEFEALAEQIVAIFNAALQRFFGPGQDAHAFPGNRQTAAAMSTLAAQAGLSPRETLHVARGLFGTTLSQRAREAGAFDPTRGCVISLRFFHADRSPRWGCAIDAHLRLKAGADASYAVPARGDPTPSRPISRKPGRGDVFADLAARVEQRRAAQSGVVIDDVPYREIAK